MLFYDTSTPLVASPYYQSHMRSFPDDPSSSHCACVCTLRSSELLGDMTRTGCPSYQTTCQDAKTRVLIQSDMSLSQERIRHNECNESTFPNQSMSSPPAAEARRHLVQQYQSFCEFISQRLIDVRPYWLRSTAQCQEKECPWALASRFATQKPRQPNTKYTCSWPMVGRCPRSILAST